MSLNDNHKHCHLIPACQDVDVLDSLEAALGPLADFTDILVQIILPKSSKHLL